MTASRLDLSRWYDQGAADGATFMIVALDTFSYENYPVYAESEEEARAEVDRLRAAQMSDVSEVYDLRRDKLGQMLAPRVWDLPAVPR